MGQRSHAYPGAKQIAARKSREARLEEAMDAGPKPKTPKALKPAGAKGTTKAAPDGKVIYIGHIPHGFYEEQMRGFFSQFGDVTRVRMSRNPKTGHSRHYAWVEFKHPAVAKVAADAMNNYLLAGQVLKVHVVAPSAVHPSTFKGCDKPFRARPRARVARDAHNAPRSAEQLQRTAQRLVKSEAQRRRKIEAAGIEYAFPGYAAEAGDLPAKAPKAKMPKAAAAVAAAAPAPAPAKAAAAAAPPAEAKPSKRKAVAEEEAAPVAAKPKRGGAAAAAAAPAAPPAAPAPPPAKRAKPAAAPPPAAADAPPPRRSGRK